jgi:hypothetical protein
MTSEPDDYDLFLVDWEPGERLLNATLKQYLSDPIARARFLEDGTGKAPLERTVFNPGTKSMSEDELRARAYDYFASRQAKWSEHFIDFVLSRGVPNVKLDAFIKAFAELWVDGRSRRQDSAEMLAIKASIQNFDRFVNPNGRAFVVNEIDDSIPALFSPCEMAAVFQANFGLIESLVPDYVDHLDYAGPESLSDLYVRRGVYMPDFPVQRIELHYLSSYSLSLGPVEQFAQTWTPKTEGKGHPSIFSAPIAAIQDRVVAFAPFIRGMDLGQLEIVVAPPVKETILRDDGEHGGIHEFSFL